MNFKTWKMKPVKVIPLPCSQMVSFAFHSAPLTGNVVKQSSTMSSCNMKSRLQRLFSWVCVCRRPAKIVLNVSPLLLKPTILLTWFTLLWNEQSVVHLKRRGHEQWAGAGAPQEEIACLKMLTAWHKVVAVLQLPCMASFFKTTLCWQAHPISYFSLNTNFISLRQPWFSQWGSPSYVWLSFYERIAFSLTAVLL